MHRGIIAAPGIVDVIGTSCQFRPALTPLDIRFYLMYWNKIIIPTNSLIHFGIPDEEDLIGCGAIWRPKTQLMNGSYNGYQMGEAIVSGQCQIANLMLKDKSTDWVIHQVGKQFYLPENLSVENNAIRVDLANALPVPGPDVHVNEILDFKERRKDELVSLHNVLDEFYLDVLNSADPTLAERKTLARLKDAIENLEKVSGERFKATSKFDFSTELNLNGKDLATAAAGGAVLDLMSGFTLPIATVAGALGSIIKITGKTTKSFSHAGNNNKYCYLSSASKQGVL